MTAPLGQSISKTAAFSCAKILMNVNVPPDAPDEMPGGLQWDLLPDIPGLAQGTDLWEAPKKNTAVPWSTVASIIVK